MPARRTDLLDLAPTPQGGTAATRRQLGHDGAVKSRDQAPQVPDSATRRPSCRRPRRTRSAQLPVTAAPGSRASVGRRRRQSGARPARSPSASDAGNARGDRLRRRCTIGTLGGDRLEQPTAPIARLRFRDASDARERGDAQRSRCRGRAPALARARRPPGPRAAPEARSCCARQSAACRSRAGTTRDQSSRCRCERGRAPLKGPPATCARRAARRSAWSRLAGRLHDQEAGQRQADGAACQAAPLSEHAEGPAPGTRRESAARPGVRRHHGDRRRHRPARAACGGLQIALRAKAGADDTAEDRPAALSGRCGRYRGGMGVQLAPRRRIERHRCPRCGTEAGARRAGRRRDAGRPLFCPLRGAAAPSSRRSADVTVSPTRVRQVGGCCC